MNKQTHPALYAALNLPFLLTMSDGTSVSSPEEWRLRRKELLHLLSDQVYGFTPPVPASVRGRITASDRIAFAGKATQQTHILSFDTHKGEFSFPFTFIAPNTSGQHPLFVCKAAP